MAQVPIEIVEIGDVPVEDVTAAISEANQIQKEFVFHRLSSMDAQRFGTRAFEKVEYKDFLNSMRSDREQIKGYHPFMVAFIDSVLTGDQYSNLYWASYAGEGLAVTTIAYVPDIILPRDRLAAYFLYQLAFAALYFLAPNQEFHPETRGCVFDFKEKKLDLLKSMRARAICDKCRESLLSGGHSLSASQFFAIDALFEKSGTLLTAPRKILRPLPRAFIGSSREGLRVARKLQSLLEDTIQSEIWDQGTTFGLSQATLESLEQAVSEYEFGIFVFTPDDELHSRQETKAIARDNVVFELGLFVGKLGRRKAFVVHPRGSVISLPTDLLERVS